jgi:hypothetical protein
MGFAAPQYVHSIRKIPRVGVRIYKSHYHSSLFAVANLTLVTLLRQAELANHQGMNRQARILVLGVHVQMNKHFYCGSITRNLVLRSRVDRALLELAMRP